MEKLCYICDVGLEDQPDVRTCDCRGPRRFVAWGACPTNPTEADKLFSALRKKFGLSKRRGPRKPITFLDVADKIRELDGDATLDDVAGALEITPRHVLRILKPLLAMIREHDRSRATFYGLQAILKGESKPRARKVFYKKIRRR